MNPQAWVPRLYQDLATSVYPAPTITILFVDEAVRAALVPMES